MHVNEDHVERVEPGSNSTIYLTNGTYLVVRDEVADVAERIRAAKVAVLSDALRASAVPSGAPRCRALVDVLHAGDGPHVGARP